MNCILCGGANLREFFPIYYRCVECRLTFLDPARRLSPTEEARRYRSHENDPDDPGYREFLKPVTELIQRARPRTILDFGCGAGAPLKVWLEPAGYKVSLFDPHFYPDPLVLEDKYDFVAATEVVEHLRDPAFEFARLRDLLNLNGTLGLMTEMLDESVDFATWYYRRDPTHIAFYARETFEWIRGKYAFSTLRCLSRRLIEFNL